MQPGSCVLYVTLYEFAGTLCANVLRLAASI
jgi:hypothetical protein